jgi:SAM-dependent methyltransferase
VSAAGDWAEALASWAIPPEILAKAPVDPWAWRVPERVRHTELSLTLDTPSQRRALERLPGDGTVLDVGCGAGAASMPLCPPAASVVGVDSDEEVLVAFAEQAEKRGTRHSEVVGGWPDVADEVESADIVVCHHVVYNIQGIEAFVAALMDRARNRVVLEMTSEHPRAWMNPLWFALHGLVRPTRPTVEDLLAVMKDMGSEPNLERWMLPTPMRNDPMHELIRFVREALCLTANRDLDVAAALNDHPPPAEREIATLWWDRE